MSSQNPFITHVSTDWRLCYLCQKQSRDQLRKPYTQARWHSAYESLETDLRNFAANDVPFPLGLHLGCLDDGSGISSTLLKNNAVCHYACRTLCRPVMLEREIRKRTIPHREEETLSPKKTLLSINASFNREIPQCVYCEKYKEDSGDDVFCARSANCDKNLLNWAIESQNWAIHSDYTAVSAEDTIAADIHYQCHSSCYTKLKYAARIAKSKTSVDSQCPGESQTYDPLVFAELLVFVNFRPVTIQTLCAKESLSRAFMDGKFVVQRATKSSPWCLLTKARSIVSSSWRTLLEKVSMANRMKRRLLNCQYLECCESLKSLKTRASNQQTNQLTLIICWTEKVCCGSKDALKFYQWGQYHQPIQWDMIRSQHLWYRRCDGPWSCQMFEGRSKHWSICVQGICFRANRKSD